MGAGVLKEAVGSKQEGHTGVRGPSLFIYILSNPVLDSCPAPHSAPRRLVSPARLVSRYQNARREVARDSLSVPMVDALSPFRARPLHAGSPPSFV